MMMVDGTDVPSSLSHPAPPHANSRVVDGVDDGDVDAAAPIAIIEMTTNVDAKEAITAIMCPKAWWPRARAGGDSAGVGFCRCRKRAAGEEVTTPLWSEFARSRARF